MSIEISLLIVSFVIFAITFVKGFHHTTTQTTSKVSSQKKTYQLNKKCNNNLCLCYGLGLGKSTSSSSSSSTCKVCSGKGGMNCKPCNGKGIDKVNGSVLERWTCKKCKGFGFVPCSSCNKGSLGLTPEQTGER
jgi:DnaJ-class molecular chaperone